jgi:hypothetical protein
VTGFFIDNSSAHQRVLIAGDSLGYSMTGDRHEPIGFVNKALQLPQWRAPRLGAGLYEVQVRVYAELMQRPELLTFAEVTAALPELIRDEVEFTASRRGVEASDTMLFAGCFVGWDEAEKRFAAVLFEGPAFAPQRVTATLYGTPSVPAAYLPTGFTGMTPELRAIAAMRAIRRFSIDHGDELGLPPIGGEIILTELLPDRISTRAAARFENYAETCETINRTRAAIAADPAAYVGVDLAHRFEDRAAAPRRVEQIFRQERGVTDDPLTRAARRRAERNARRAGRAA